MSIFIDAENKSLNEKAKKFKKYKKNQLGWFQKFSDGVKINAGNCEINAAAFNRQYGPDGGCPIYDGGSTSGTGADAGAGEGAGMGESLKNIDTSKSLSDLSEKELADIVDEAVYQHFPDTYTVYGRQFDADDWEERDVNVEYSIEDYERVVETDADGESYELFNVTIEASAEGESQTIELEIPLYDLDTIEDLIDYIRSEERYIHLDFDIDYDYDPTDYDDIGDSLESNSDGKKLTESVEKPLTIDDKFNYIKNYPVYNGSNGTYFTRPCKINDLNLTEKQAENFYKYWDNGNLEGFWNKYNDLAHDIYQDGRMGGHLILDKKVIDPNYYIDLEDLDDAVNEYIGSNYYSNYDGEYDSEDIEEANREVRENIDRDYALLKDFDNRVDELIKLLKKDLDDAPEDM